MQGNEKLLVLLNQRLADELTAINQNMVHSEMCDNWGFHQLHTALKNQALDAMQHAEWLIERIIFLDGVPTVSKLNNVKIGKTVLEMINIDNTDENDAVCTYEAAISLAQEIGDEGTIELLTKILKMKKGNVDWAEIQRSQIKHMGLQNYLANQSELLAS